MLRRNIKRLILDLRVWLTADHENAAVRALIHGPLVLRVLGLHIRLIRQNFESDCFDDHQQILETGLDTVLSLAVGVVVQQWSQIDPNPSWFQDAVRENVIALNQNILR